ncbi:MAG: DUF4136 domain-containing protein [Victivallales bacterium]|jgi:hypothetical protein|nr:DUF4136 domain-containing protein [Victivallales bacterium]
MRKRSYQVLGVFTVGALLAGMIGCSSLRGTRSKDLLENPSLHILVSDESPIAATGTFDFDTKLFKVNYSEEVDLTAVDWRVVTALEAELRRQGFKRATKNPDLLVSYAVAMDSSVSGAELNEAYADEFPISVPEPKTGTRLDYHQGALIVDFVDAKSRTLLWRGSIMAHVGMQVTDREKTRRIRDAARILLAHFPKPKQNGT